MLRINEKESCTGCSACMNICPRDCISMVSDIEGFKYPKVDVSKCINCKMCEKVCPVSHIKKEELVGFPKAYLTWSTDSNINAMSTSGGLVSSMARDIIDQNGHIVGAVYADDPTEGVHHAVFDSIDDVSSFARSKYVQSDILKTYKDVGNLLLSSEKPVLFVGTGCQVYGLKSYLKLRYHRDDFENLFAVDVICHGVPSPLLLKKYIQHLEIEYGAIVTKVEMRHKKKVMGLFSEAQTNVFFSNGEVYSENAGVDLFGRCFWGEISSRPSCYKCPFKTIGRISDITVGDCWFSRALSGSKDIPYDCTLAFVQSPKGNELLKMTKLINSFEVNSELAIKANGGMMYESASPHPKRTEFFEQLDSVPLDNLVEQFLLNENSNVAQSGKLDKVKMAVKSCIKKVPGVYDKYYFLEKNREFQSRCERQIDKGAICKCVID